MNAMKMFARITKVDEAKREVWGRLVHETPDRADEIFDYESSKPHFKAWSEEFAKATTDAGQELSLGNMRAMHGKVAAGKFTHIEFNDTEKAIDVCGKVVDDNEWKKVLEGVYTGYSIGGSYVGEKTAEKLGDKTLHRYTAKPTEGSLVDSPCVPTAKFFEVRKADGAIEKVAFKEPGLEVRGTDEEVAAFAKALNDGGLTLKDALALIAEKAAADTMLETSADLKKREFSTEERDKAAESGAALPDGSFPIKTVSDLRNAVKAYGRAKDKEKAKAHIISRAKALGATAELPEGWGKMALTELEKDFAETVAFVELKKRLADPELPFAEFVDIAKARLSAEEFAAIKGGDVAKLSAAILAKANLSAAHKDRVQAIHDHAASMGADCDADTDKSAKANIKKAADQAQELQNALKRIEALERQPAPHVVTLRVVEKGNQQSHEHKDALQAMPYEKLVKFADGTIDWKASEQLLQSGAAA